MNNSVPIGYRENWAYRGHWAEEKKKDKKGKTYWNVEFNATKRRKSKSLGNFGIGSYGAWKLNGIQYIIKKGKGIYQTKLIAKKYPLKFTVRRPRKSRKN